VHLDEFPRGFTAKYFIEPIILYAVLFFPALSAGLTAPAADMVQFSIARELARVLGYNIPALLLLWYLGHIRGKSLFSAGIRTADFQSLAIALPGLLGLGLFISVLALLSNGKAAPAFETPRGLLAWTVTAVSCLSTGYVEESYFRHYLLGGFEESGTNMALGIAVSTALFALCHFYEGLWGALNAVFAGLLLSLIYRRYGALHGIAWAHGLYNAFIYASGG
jgi:membrane protease YdiL (CAAX protease family)